VLTVQRNRRGDPETGDGARRLDCFRAEAPHDEGKQSKTAAVGVMIMLILYPILAVLVILLAAAIVYHIVERMPRLAQAIGGRASGGRSDPQTAAAAMMYAVATEYAPLTAEQERHIQSLLCSRMGLDPAAARTCMTGGRRIASRLHGDLNSRLHQLLGPVEHGCSRKEKQDVIDMLRIIAGPLAQRLGPVREGLGRVSATLMRG
jgi:hypothetical protein